MRGKWQPNWKLAALAGLAPFAGLTGVTSAGIVVGTDFSSENGHVYKVVTERISWQDAREEAADQGGYLATITGSAEQASVEKLLAQASVPAGSYWFGLHASATDAQYSYITGESVSFTNFSGTAPQPASFGGADSNGAVLWAGPHDPTFGERGQWNVVAKGTGSSSATTPRGFVIEFGPLETGDGTGGGSTGGTPPDDGGSTTPIPTPIPTPTPTVPGNTDGSGTGTGTPSTGGGDGTGETPGTGTGIPPVVIGGGNTGGGPAAVPLPVALYLFPAGMAVAAYSARRFQQPRRK